MHDQRQEDADYELNARYDYVREAYAATALDPWQEGYSSYCDDADDAGAPVLGFDEWKAQQVARQRAPVQAWSDAGGDDLPF